MTTSDAAGAQGPGPARPKAPAPRPLPVLILADVSGSMGEDDKINVLNRSVATMFRTFAEEDSARGQIHVGAITFGGEAAAVHHPVVPAPRASWRDMEAGGRTPMGHAFTLARELLEDEQAVPRRSFRATIVLCSDGKPNDDWEEPLERLLSSDRGSRALRLAVGIGTDIDKEARAVLRAFVADPEISVMPAEQVDRISQFFQWVTMSVTSRLHSGRPDDIPALRLDDLDGLL